MNFLRNFMTGRYGPDHLNMALLILAIIISLVARLVHFTVLVYLSYLVLLLIFFRMLSRNIPRRRAENDRFLRYWWPVKQKTKRLVGKIKNRKTHKFFKCPSCKNTLRVPPWERPAADYLPEMRRAVYKENIA